RAAKEEASRRRDEAAENYRMGRRAVDRYYTEVSEDIILNEPGMEALRRRLLAAAREFYAQFADQRTDDPRVKAEPGRALLRLARTRADGDGPAKGVELHRQALAVFSELAEARPEDTDILVDQAACLHHLGRLEVKTDHLAAAREAYQGALALWLRLQQSH